MQPDKRYIDPAAYLAMEETAEVKSEYFHGEAFAMTGATHAHNVIAVNIASALHAALRDRDCFVYAGDMKIEIDPDKHYAYPDVSAVCGDVAFAGGRKDTVANPVVIFEVLSDATRDYDRGSKFTAYRKVRSLQDYILVDQHVCFVEYFYKDAAGRWSLQELDRIDDVLTIRSLGVELTLRTVYFRLNV